jgi:transcriptional regulator with XRE-family HTH domain
VNTWEPREPVWPGRPPAPNSLGQRIASLRIERGWTQQQLSERLGVSRVAISHLETDINSPGERTVALLAGVFRVEPHELVAGTSYPAAKADRLPLVVARWTEVEHQLALLERDLDWLARTGGRGASGVLAEWEVTLDDLLVACHDPDEREALATARRRVGDLRRA